MYDLIVVGGGAAGFFGAIQAAERHKKVLLLEKTGKVLSKVRISGGGRCNVTHACFDPRALTRHYPRGEKELLGPFTRFQPKDTIQWFEGKGISLKKEEDGRMFPTTDDSETIIQCLLAAAKNVELRLGVSIDKIEKCGSAWNVYAGGEILEATSLLLATGSVPLGHRFAESMGHTLISPVPSLFTFNTPSSPLLDLSGMTLPNVQLHIEGTPLKEKGPLLLTHFGFSGPAVLRLSAWGARELFARDYRATLRIDWTAGTPAPIFRERLLSQKRDLASQPFAMESIIDCPRALVKRFQEILNIKAKRFADLSSKDINAITDLLQCSRYQIEGKTTHKQEFVTCGGVKLSEVNFKTMESRICPGLYFAGEILDIDGITGGFNFQNAWTTGWIAGNSI